MQLCIFLYRSILKGLLVGVIDLLRIMSRVAASDNSFQLATWVLREFGRSNSKFKVDQAARDFCTQVQASRDLTSRIIQKRLQALISFLLFLSLS